jgi:Domain of unknown function (DUF5060)/Domain of unknown function (DUF5605)/Protein of unknown function (DUF4038)
VTEAMLRLILLLTFCLAAFAQTERWTIHEISLPGPSAGNPFVDVEIGARFDLGPRTIDVDGFYDGQGTYKIRFMPDTPGEWKYTTHSNRPELNGKSGKFICTPARAGNHGPVRVRNTTHFSYEDGSTYIPMGTTAYAWTHQGDALEEQTLASLRTAPFNKMRMCVFPKSYAYNANEPVFYPFENNNYTRPNPAFFAHLEKRVADLEALGIEADLILFHPYDRWGYAKMGAAADDLYLRYTVARLAAYRNVWWSVANEWDLMKGKTVADWDRYFHIIEQRDAYRHLRSIHHSKVMYDHSKPWVTHVSIQGDDFEKSIEWLSAYKKPVIFDECQYEGNIPRRWGSISAQEMVRRFWLGTVYGAYVGHGETYLDPRDILWWSKGGVLHGESPQRIAFLRKILDAAPPEGIDNISNYYPAAGVAGKYYLFYFDTHQPAEYEFDLAKGAQYQADILDPWAMTITPIAGVYEGKFTLKLPGKPNLAITFRKVS